MRSTTSNIKRLIGYVKTKCKPLAKVIKRKGWHRTRSRLFK